MELIGEEKRIQDLFRELRVEDARFAPRFSAVWNRADARVNRPSRLFKLAFAAATVLLAFALFSLPWWSKHWPSTQPRNDVALAPAVPKVSPVKTVTNPEPKNVVGVVDQHSSRALKTRAVHHQSQLALARQSAIREAAAMSKWQSPTSTLLSSSSDDVFTSLPQLNENANELKSFLPGRNK